MTWDYSGNPSSSAKDAVRFLSGDTDEDDPLVSDEEIAYILTQESNPYEAAALVCEALASKFARETSVSGDGFSESGGELSRQFKERAKDLRMQSGGRSKPRPYVGGISYSERENADADGDLVKHSFRSDMHTYPGTTDSPFTSGLESDQDTVP